MHSSVEIMNKPYSKSIPVRTTFPGFMDSLYPMVLNEQERPQSTSTVYPPPAPSPSPPTSNLKDRQAT